MSHREQFDAFLATPAARAVAFSSGKTRCTCPCCGYPTLEERGGFRYCALCDWEDDGQDDPDADVVRQGPNRDYSLAEARDNFAAHGSMYRPSDRVAFENGRRKSDVKRSLMAIYHKMLATNDQPQLSALAGEAEQMTAALRTR